MQAALGSRNLEVYETCGNPETLTYVWSHRKIMDTQQKLVHSLW